jgi:hypothetical protein
MKRSKQEDSTPLSGHIGRTANDETGCHFLRQKKSWLITQQYRKNTKLNEREDNPGNRVKKKLVAP